MKFRRVDCVGEGITGFGVSPFQTGWTLVDVSAPTEQYPTKVPGNVQLTLMEAGKVPDPFQGQNNEALKWIPTRVWEYHNHIDLKPWIRPILQRWPKGGLLHLIFDAIDYDASFFIANQRVTRQTGMFSPIDLVCAVTPTTEQTLAQETQPIPLSVKFHRQPWWRTHAVKSQMAFGWDFAPEIRTVGIWREVRFQYTGPAFFTEVWAFFDSTRPKREHEKIHVQGKISFLDVGTLVDDDQAHSLILEVQTNTGTTTHPISVKSNQRFEVIIDHSDLPQWSPWRWVNRICARFRCESFSMGRSRMNIGGRL